MVHEGEVLQCLVNMKPHHHQHHHNHRHHHHYHHHYRRSADSPRSTVGQMVSLSLYHSPQLDIYQFRAATQNHRSHLSIWLRADLTPSLLFSSLRPIFLPPPLALSSSCSPVCCRCCPLISTTISISRRVHFPYGRNRSINVDSARL